MLRAAVALAALALQVPLALAAGEQAKFASPPTITREGDAVRIAFEASAATDVEVAIVGKDGRVVRHLAAGVLGENAPAPLAKNSLKQTLVWDGKDDLGLALDRADGLSVRVRLGMDATYDRVIMDDPLSLGSVRSLAVGADGTLYLRMSTGTPWPNSTGEVVIALDRDGKHLRMVMPYPADLARERLGDVSAVEVAGRPVPVVRDVALRDFYGGVGPLGSGMAVTPGGQLLFPLPDVRLAAWRWTARATCWSATRPTIAW